MGPTQTLDLIARLSACSVAVQTAELWVVRDAFSERGIYRQAQLRSELESLPLALRSPLERVLEPSTFLRLLAVQLGACAATLIFGCTPLVWITFFTALLVCMRMRGSYNGGSDSMTLLTLLALAMASSTRSEWLQRGCIFYIAVQTSLSYFLAGIVKLKEPSWRDGRALRAFLRLSRYAAPGTVTALADRPSLAMAASVALIGFECTFPFALFRTPWALWYLSLGLLFHAANSWILGLNRFWWAWAATYPAVWYVSQ